MYYILEHQGKVLGMTKRSTEINIEGETTFARNGGVPMYHHERTDIDFTEVVVTLNAYGDNTKPVAPVRSTHPAVIAYARAIDQARLTSAHINRTVTPILKDRSQRLDVPKMGTESPPDLCPVCRNQDGIRDQCATCDGVGYVEIDVEV
jgi:hypothetical protein